MSQQFKTGMKLSECLVAAEKLGCRIDKLPGRKVKLFMPGNTAPVEFSMNSRAPQILTRALIRWQTNRELASGLPDRGAIELPKLENAPRPNFTGAEVAGFGARMETISPEIAREWISITETNGDVNRGISDLRVAALAKAIQEGRWDAHNGETIKLHPNGSVGDGQHRLWGIIFANESVKALVVRNVPRESFATIDTGMPRSAAQVIGLAGETNTTQLAACARFLTQVKETRALETGIRPTARKSYMPPDAVIKVIQSNPRIRDSVKMAQRTRTGQMAIIPVGPVAVAYFLTSQIAPSLAETFFGTDLAGKGTEQETGHPARKLRDTFTNARLRGTAYSSETALAIILKAWNAYRAGVKVQLLGFRPDQENFPTIDGAERIVIN